MGKIYVVVLLMVLFCENVKAENLKKKSSSTEPNVKFANRYKAKTVTSDKVKRNAVNNIIESGKYINENNLRLNHNLKPFNRQIREKISKKIKSRNFVSKCKKDNGCGKSNEEKGNSKSVIEDDMPNTVLPNPNIYGGFPENDIWGNFELPPPSILRKLKQQLKAEPFYHKPNYGDQDPTDQSYSYESRAFPEYDFMETPSFQQLMQQHIKSNAPACDPAEPSCRHISSSKCANFVKLCAMNAKHTKQGEIENEGPCASKILEMFGCKPKKSKPDKLNLVESSVALNSAKIEKLPDHEKLNESARLHADQNGDPTLNSVLSIENEINKFMDTLNTGHLDSTSDKTTKYQENKENSNALQQDDKSNTSKLLFHDGTLDTQEKNIFSNKTNYKSNTDIDTEKLTNAIVSSTDKNDGMLTEEDPGARMFSDWSSWSKCSCIHGSIMRRRNCLLTQCVGATEERKPCNNTQCSRNGTLFTSKLLEEVTLETSNNSSADLLDYKSEPAKANLTLQDGSINQHNINITRDSVGNNSSKNVNDDFVVDKLISRFVSNIAQSQENHITLPNSFDSLNLYSKNSSHPSVNQEEERNHDKTDSESFTVRVIDQSQAGSLGEHSVHNGSESADDIASAIVRLLSKKIDESSQFPLLTKNNKYPGADKREGLSCNTNRCNHSEQSIKSCAELMKTTCVEPLKICRNSTCRDSVHVTESGNECLSLLNGYRKRHGAVNLEWSNDLYNRALVISKRIALHNIPSRNLAFFEKPGVNLGYVLLQKKNLLTTPCAKALENWYAQKKNYRYESPKVTINNQDFTQLIWKSSKKVGIAQVESVDKTAFYVTAVYEPAGNVNSDTRKNILPFPSSTPEADILKDLFTNTKKSKLLKRKN